MLKSRGKSTARKPLANMSNVSKRSRLAKQVAPPEDVAGDDGAIDRLLLVRSDLFDLMAQVDELVAQALGNKTVSNGGVKVIESFKHVLRDMHSSLKAWVPKLQQAFACTSTETARKLAKSSVTRPVSFKDSERSVLPNDGNNKELRVSPSPLVSWRAGNCTVDCGRQLFLLTPLPKSQLLSSKKPGLSCSSVGQCANKDCHSTHGMPGFSNNLENANERRVMVQSAASEFSKSCTVAAKCTLGTQFLSPLFISSQKEKDSSTFIMSPCLKKSPPKTCPLRPFSFQQDDKNKKDDAPVSDDSANEEIETLAFKYQELFGLQDTYKQTNLRKEVDESLDWFLSPPKTCILMEPSDEKSIPTQANVIMFATPVFKCFESTVKKGKHPGENTLKKELWTKFEAVSINELGFNPTVPQKTVKKGFLDMLEEVSCESVSQDQRDAR